MPRFRNWLDHEGEPITHDGCNCDIDENGAGVPCNDATCVMERDLEMRHWMNYFAHQRRINPPVPEMGDYERALYLREHPWEGDLDLARDIARGK